MLRIGILLLRMKIFFSFIFNSPLAKTRRKPPLQPEQPVLDLVAAVQDKQNPLGPASRRHRAQTSQLPAMRYPVQMPEC